MDDVAEKVREGRGKKIGMYCHLQEFTLRRNILSRDNSPWVSCVFACLTSEGSECLYSQLCFPGYLYIIQKKYCPPLKQRISLLTVLQGTYSENSRQAFYLL